MKPPTPIPVPFAVRWRAFRLSVIPIIVFASVVGVIAFLWRNHGGGGTLQGIGEGVRSLVAAPQTVRVEEWLVEPHTVVTAGTPLAVVKPVDPRADFDLLRSQFELARVRSQPSLAEDNAMNFERVRVELLRTKAELAIARVKLEQAERDVARNTPLYREKLVAEDIYELSVNTRDALKAEVEENSKAVAEIERRFQELRSIGEPDELRDASANGEWLTGLETAQATAAKNLEPLTLVAPISGMVGLPQRQAGEFVPAGEPLLAINSLRSDRIIAYLRQPYRMDPQVGMPAEVTTRTRRRVAFMSRVAQVGAQLEALTNSLAFVRPGALVDMGLPVIVPVPEGINIRPGEIVDVSILEPPAKPPAPSAQTNPTHPRL